MSRSAAVKTDNALVRYFKDVRAEVSKVTWPTREEGTRLTAVVMAVTVGSALFLFSFDSLFSLVITWLISL